MEKSVYLSSKHMRYEVIVISIKSKKIRRQHIQEELESIFTDSNMSKGLIEDKYYNETEEPKTLSLNCVENDEDLVDQDELQLKDEMDKEWCALWKKELKRSSL